MEGHRLHAAFGHQARDDVLLHRKRAGRASGEKGAVQDVDAGVDGAAAAAGGLLGEPGDPRPVEQDPPEAADIVHLGQGQGQSGSAGPVVGEKRVDVHVDQAVAVGDQNRFRPGGGQGVQQGAAGAEGLGLDHPVHRQRGWDVPVVADHRIGQMAKRQDDVADGSAGGVGAEQMVEEGPAGHRCQRLRHVGNHRGEPCSASAREDDGVDRSDVCNVAVCDRFARHHAQRASTISHR